MREEEAERGQIVSCVRTTKGGLESCAASPATFLSNRKFWLKSFLADTLNSRINSGTDKARCIFYAFFAFFEISSFFFKK